MIYLNCFYMLDDNVFFISGEAMLNGRHVLIANKCVSNDASDYGNSVMDNKYRITDEKLLIDADAFHNAENLSEKCLKCEYCRNTLLNNYHYGTLSCSLHKRIVPEKREVMIPECEYGLFPLDFKPEKNKPEYDIKKFFRNVTTKHQGVFIPTDYCTIPQEVFLSLVGLMDPNEKIYFGTGRSYDVHNDKGLYHETAQDYLSNPEKDKEVLCFLAKNFSKGTYDFLANEQSTDKIYNVIAIPCLELACFGDDESNGYEYGFMLYAPALIIKKVVVMCSDLPSFK